MAMRKLQLRAGVDLESSASLNEVQLNASNLIRFYSGFVQKLGGWMRMTQQRFVGVCRGLHGWADILGNAYLGLGTDQRLQVLKGGMIEDITPITQTDNPAVAFSTATGSSLVTILDALYTPVAGDWINLQTHVSVGGLILFGFYRVVSITDGTHYVVDAGHNASATVTGGAVPSFTTTNLQSTVSVALANHGLSTGSLFTLAIPTIIAAMTLFGTFSVTSVTGPGNFVITAAGTANASTTAAENSGNARIQYLLASGVAVTTPRRGYGAGPYGGGAYGVGSGIINVPVRQWSLDHFGQDLIASPSDGAIYYWQPPNISPALIVAASAPIYNNAVFVMPQAEIIVALGAEIAGTKQPLLIRWCAVADFTDWVASARNQAGSYSIPTGSGLVGGLAVGLGAMLWTDQDVWSMTYLGFPLVFGFNRIAPNCGLVGPRAAGNIGGIVMWIGLHQFFRHSGGVSPVECSVWDFYWYNVDKAQLGQIHCAVNTIFNEMAWFFPIKTDSPLYNPLAPLGYVKFNLTENVFDYGLSPQYQRTAWAPHSPVGDPVGADMDGLLQQHEQGFDADGSAMLWSWQTGYFDIDDGQDFTFSDMMIPDFVTIGTPIFVPNILTLDEPNGAPTTVVAPQFSSETLRINYEARGRQMSTGFAGSPSSVGDFSRLGAIRVRYSADGRANG